MKAFRRLSPSARYNRFNSVYVQTEFIVADISPLYSKYKLLEQENLRSFYNIRVSLQDSALLLHPRTKVDLAEISFSLTLKNVCSVEEYFK